MLVKYFRYSVYFITITLLISGCSSNRAPVFEKNQNGETREFREKRTMSKKSLTDFPKDKLVSQVNDSFFPKNIGIILPFDSAYENISKSIINGITEAYYSSPKFMASTKLFFYSSNATSRRNRNYFSFYCYKYFQNYFLKKYFLEKLFTSNRSSSSKSFFSLIFTFSILNLYVCFKHS